MLVALLVLSLLTGYRRGATLQVIGLIGLAVGVVAGVLLAPRVATLASSPSGAIALAMGTVLIGGAVGNLAGWVIGSRIRPRNEGSSIRRVATCRSVETSCRTSAGFARRSITSH